MAASTIDYGQARTTGAFALGTPLCVAALIAGHVVIADTSTTATSTYLILPVGGVPNSANTFGYEVSNITVGVNFEVTALTLVQDVPALPGFQRNAADAGTVAVWKVLP